MLRTEPLIKFGERALTFLREPCGIEEVKSVFESLDKASPNYNFWVGDILGLAEKYYGKDWIKVIPQGASKKTFANLRWVSRKISPPMRRWPVSFGHYAQVAGKSDIEKELLLDLVVEEGWSVGKLKWEMKPRDIRMRESTTVCPQCGYSWESGH